MWGRDRVRAFVRVNGVGRTPLGVAAVGLALAGSWFGVANATAAGSWSPTGGSNEPAYNGAIALTELQGEPLVVAAGGQDNGGYTSRVSLYDPSTGTWTPGPTAHSVGYDARAIALDDGRVLAVGGSSFEIYDPVARSWSQSQPVGSSQDEATLTRLADGQILIAGGGNGFAANGGGNRATALFDPATNSVQPTGSLTNPRIGALAVRLPDGRVLLVGGCCSSDDSWRTTEIYDPVTRQWTLAAPMLVTRHFQPGNSLQLLPNGKVLAVGGVNGSRSSSGNPRSAEIYDPVTNTWTMTSPMPNQDQTGMVAALADGTILQTGIGTASTSLYDPASDTWSVGPTMSPASNFSTGVLLPSGALLATGGTTFSSLPPQSALYGEGTGGLIATTTTVAADRNPSAYGERVTFTATVSPVDGHGTVAFSLDGAPVAGCAARPLITTSSGYQATCTTSDLGHPGPHEIRAAYSGDAQYAGSFGTAQQTVVKAATSLSAAPAVLRLNPLAAPLFNLTATLAAAGSPLAHQPIVFSAGSTTLCTVATTANGKATCNTFSNVSALLAVLGANGYSARYGGSADYEASNGSAGLIG